VTARGYTVVEVMMALAVLTVGTTGVIAMQKAALIANTNARNLVAANAVAQSWVERLRVDALGWTEPGHVPDLDTNTMWLKNVGIGWFTPAASQGPGFPAGSPQDDVMGADIFAGDPSAPAFCTQLRLLRISSDPNSSYYRVIRVEVAVYWDQTGRQLVCTSPLPTDYQLSRYGFVSVVTSVLENNSPL
jgi:type IV pilus assembly protein PilV